jgi:spermidine/putrescine transport system substrate-binding protein
MTFEDSHNLREALTRRRLLRRAAQVGALAAVPGLLAACGSDDGGSTSTGGSTAQASTGGTTTTPNVTGTIALLTYPDWIGDKEIQWFEEKYPGASVKEVADTSSGAAATVALLSRNKGDYDIVLGGKTTGMQLEAAGLLEPFDPTRAPNVQNMPQSVRDALPIGVPGDMGKTGFAYRKDLMSERPTTWKEFWDLTKGKYSGKTTMFKYDVDVTGVALIYSGHPVNATDQKALDDAKAALIDIKPHLRALLSTNLSKPLLEGTAVMAVDYDYDIALAQEKNPDIVWVAPEEGLPAYIEGWLPLKDSKNLDTVYAFLNHHMEPKVYANYINTIGASYLMPKAEPFIKESIKGNPALKWNEDEFNRIEFVQFLGAEAAAARAKMWEEFLAA